MLIHGVRDSAFDRADHRAQGCDMPVLERDLEQPYLKPVRDWFDTNVGPGYRREPWKEAA